MGADIETRIQTFAPGVIIRPATKEEMEAARKIVESYPKKKEE